MIDQLYQLVAAGEVDAALDLLFKTFDDLYDEGGFAECDAHIQAMDLDKLGVCLVVGVLSITLTPREKLASREEFLQRAESYLQRVVPDRLDGLLKGLR